MTDTTDTPIVVNSSAFWGMAAAFARDALKAAGAGLVTKGVISASLLDQGVGLLIAGAPMVYTQLKTLWNHRKLVKLASLPQVPDSVARVQ